MGWGKECVLRHSALPHITSQEESVMIVIKQKSSQRLKSITTKSCKNPHRWFTLPWCPSLPVDTKDPHKNPFILTCQRALINLHEFSKTFMNNSIIGSVYKQVRSFITYE